MENEAEEEVERNACARLVLACISLCRFRRFRFTMQSQCKQKFDASANFAK